VPVTIRGRSKPKLPEHLEAPEPEAEQAHDTDPEQEAEAGRKLMLIVPIGRGNELPA
jgi:hypothetical protein